MIIQNETKFLAKAINRIVEKNFTPLTVWGFNLKGHYTRIFSLKINSQ
jgi:hypothetical protein